MPNDSPPAGAGPRIRTAAEILLLLAGLFVFAANFRQIEPGSDGERRFEALDSLIEKRELTQTPYSLVGPLFSSPLYLLGKYHQSPRWWCEWFNLILLIAGLVSLTVLLRRHLPGRTIVSFLVLLTLATMFPRHQSAYYGEVFSAVFAAVGIAIIAAGDGSMGWVMLVLATVNSPATGGALLLIAGLRAWERQRFRYLLVPLLAVGLVLLENWIRRGNPMLTGYEQDQSHGGVFMPVRKGFESPIFFGLIGVLFSTGKGILWFHPGILFALADWKKPEIAIAKRLWGLWLLFLLGLVIVYAKWWCWWGGWFWGPRFFLFAAFPAALALAWRWEQVRDNSSWQNLFLLAAIVLSFWVGVNGLVYNQANLDVFLKTELNPHEVYMWHVPEFSVLWFPFVVTPAMNEKVLTKVEIGTLWFYAAACAFYALPVLWEQFRRLKRWLSELAPTHLAVTRWKW